MQAGNGYYADGSASGVQPPAGEFSTNIGSINSTTADNGWMVFDCDYFNTPFLKGMKTPKVGLLLPLWTSRCGLGGNHVGAILPLLLLPVRSIYLEVSNDGGATWTTFDAHGTFIESANLLRRMY